ncbi:MAG: phenylacetate--CoA ligase family protein [Deltaproteobacteria bacterium]|nr:phenylacetate--CoA ligase family protein [Deltaproteobacteria bacterium]
MPSIIEKIFWNCFTVWHARHEGALPFWSRERLAELQGRRVRSMVAHAYASVPFYREVMDRRGLKPGDFRTADDLAKLPLISGEDLADGPERFLSRDYAGERSFCLATSGTSGRAKHVRYNPEALFLMMACGHRQRTVLAHFLGKKFGYREMVVAPHVSVGFQLREFYQARSWIPRRVDFTRGELPIVVRLEDSIRKLNSFKPELLRGNGSYIGVVFRRAHELRLAIHRPKAILYGATPIADYDRSLIETEFGIPVVSSYQSTEALRIAYQCERKEGFHINMDHTAVRVIDARGEAAGPGESGDVVISNLVNRATVLLNYKQGDMAAMGRENCPCGRSLPTIERLQGRSGCIFRLPGDRIIHGVLLMEELQAIRGVAQLQIIQGDLRTFLVRVVCCSGAEWPTTRERVRAVTLSILGADIALELVPVDCIPLEPGGKIRPIISPFS